MITMIVGLYGHKLQGLQLEQLLYLSLYSVFADSLEEDSKEDSYIRGSLSQLQFIMETKEAITITQQEMELINLKIIQIIPITLIILTGKITIIKITIWHTEIHQHKILVVLMDNLIMIRLPMISIITRDIFDNESMIFYQPIKIVHQHKPFLYLIRLLYLSIYIQLLISIIQLKLQIISLIIALLILIQTIYLHQYNQTIRNLGSILSTNKSYHQNIKTNNNMKIQTFQKLATNIIYIVVFVVATIISLYTFFLGQWDNAYFSTYFVLIASGSIGIVFFIINYMNNSPNIILKSYRNNQKYKKVRKLPSIPLNDNDIKDNKVASERKLLKEQQVFLNQEQTHKSLKTNKLFSNIKKKNKHKQINPESNQREMKNSFFTSRNNQVIEQQGDDITQFFKKQKQNKKAKGKRQGSKEQTEKKPYHLFSSIRSLGSDNDSNDSQERDFIVQSKNDVIERQDYQERKQRQIRQYKMKEELIYKERYQQFKNTLTKLYIDKQKNLPQMLTEIKQIIREKLQENVKIQQDNLNKITELVKDYYSVSFKNYDGNSSNKAQSSSMFYRQLNQFNNQSKDQNIQITFQQMLTQIFGLLKTKYIDYQFKGSYEKRDEITRQLNILLKERKQLDKFLSVETVISSSHRPYQIEVQSSMNQTLKFANKRYHRINSFKRLIQILSQKNLSYQQGLLKQYFNQSTSIHLNNQDILIRFAVEEFNRTISKLNCLDECYVTLNCPLFKDKSRTHIWVRKTNNPITHYNVKYSLKKQIQLEKLTKVQLEKLYENMSKRSQVMQQKQAEQELNCMPGFQNVWTSILFIRIIIQEAQLKDKTLSNTMKDVIKLSKFLKD